MNLFETKNLMTIHLVFAAFMLPICLLFLVTGILYFMFEYDGTYHVTDHQLNFESPIVKDIEVMTPIIKSELEELGYALPQGWSGIGEYDNAPYYQLEWHEGIDRIIRLKPSEDGLNAELSVYDASFIKKLMLLHMAYGDNTFRIYSIVFSTILFLMFVTGYILALKMKKHRNLTIYSSILSVVFFWIVYEMQ